MPRVRNQPLRPQLPGTMRVRGYQAGGGVGMSNPLPQKLYTRNEGEDDDDYQARVTASQAADPNFNRDAYQQALRMNRIARSTYLPDQREDGGFYTQPVRPDPDEYNFITQYVPDPVLNNLYNALQTTIQSSAGTRALTPEEAAAATQKVRQLEQQIINRGGKPYQYFTNLPFGNFTEGRGPRPGYDPMTGGYGETPPALPPLDYDKPETPITLKPEWRTSSCFVAGTPIDMADGSSKNIEDIIVDDEVNTQDGSLDTVIHVHDIPEALKTLVTINDRITCTDSHPFLTEEGWKSFNPEASKPTYEEYGIEIGQLEVGDNLVTVNGLEEVTELISREEVAKVYNFTTDQTHTYLVDGIVTHNKSYARPTPDGTDGPIGRSSMPPGFTASPGPATMALVPFYNPTTGESWTAPSGGYSPGPGWVRGTKEEYEASSGGGGNPGRDMSPKRPGEDWFAYHERVGTTQQQGDAARAAAGLAYSSKPTMPTAAGNPSTDRPADGRYGYGHEGKALSLADVEYLRGQGVTIQADGSVSPADFKAWADTRGGVRQHPEIQRRMDRFGMTAAQAEAHNASAVRQGADLNNDGYVTSEEFATFKGSKASPPDTGTPQVMTRGLDGKMYPNPAQAEAANVVFLNAQNVAPPPITYPNVLGGQMYANQPSAVADMTTMQNPYVFGGYGAPPSMPYAGMATPQIPSIMGMAPTSYYGGSAQPVGMADPTQRVTNS